MDRKRELGRRVRRLRENRGWERKDLSKRSGLPVAHICMIENRQKLNITVWTAAALAKALDVTIDELIDFV